MTAGVFILFSISVTIMLGLEADRASMLKSEIEKARKL